MTDTTAMRHIATFEALLRDMTLHPVTYAAYRAAIAALAGQADAVYAGMSVAEAIKLGKRYAKDHDKLSPRLAQTLECLTFAAAASIGAEAQEGK